jgi:acyl-homoserine lactone acylase PvdQ
VVEDARLLLHSFDCNFSTSSYRASLYEVFMFELYQLMKPLKFDKMSLITFHHMQQGLYNYIHSAHRGNVSKQATMRAAWPKVLTRLQKHFGTEDHTQWEWGSFHHDTNRHLPFRNSALLSRFYDRESPGFGNFHTPNVGKMEKLEFGNFDTTHRANIRLLFGFGEGFVDEWIVDGGASESVFSSKQSIM